MPSVPSVYPVYTVSVRPVYTIDIATLSLGLGQHMTRPDNNQMQHHTVLYVLYMCHLMLKTGIYSLLFYFSPKKDDCPSSFLSVFWGNQPWVTGSILCIKAQKIILMTHWHSLTLELHWSYTGDTTVCMHSVHCQCTSSVYTDYTGIWSHSGSV